MTPSPDGTATPTFTLSGTVDPDLAPVDPDVAPVVDRGTPLDLIRAELAAEVATPDLTLEVTGRPGYAVTYSTTIDYAELVAWRKRAKDKSNPAGVDELKLACIILANRCTGIRRNGDPVLLDGQPLTFAHPAMLELVDAGRAIEAVRKFYGIDPHVSQVAGRLLEEAGYTDDVGEAGDELDPTTR